MQPEFDEQELQSAAELGQSAPVEFDPHDTVAISTETALEDLAWSEWFSEGEDEPAPLQPRRHHHVTAVLVSHDGDTWLPAVLTTLANQTRQPNAFVGVDTDSNDQSRGRWAGARGTGAGRGVAGRRRADHVGVAAA